MQSGERDVAYLWDIADAAKNIQVFIAGVSWYEYSNNRLMQAAVERKLEIIGEAARRISVAFREAHPEIAWKSMIGLRNVLAHEYGEILQDQLWYLATELIPKLIETLSKLIPEPPSGDKDLV